MNSEISGVVFILLLTFVLAYPFGKYISRVFTKVKKHGVISFHLWKISFLGSVE